MSEVTFSNPGLLMTLQKQSEKNRLGVLNMEVVLAFDDFAEAE